MLPFVSVPQSRVYSTVIIIADRPTPWSIMAMLPKCPTDTPMATGRVHGDQSRPHQGETGHCDNAAWVDVEVWHSIVPCEHFSSVLLGGIARIAKTDLLALSEHQRGRCAPLTSQRAGSLCRWCRVCV